MIIHHSICCFFQDPQHFGLLNAPQMSCFSQLGASPCTDNTWLPTLALRLLEKWPGRKRAVLVNQWRLPSFISHTCGVDRGAQNTFFMSLQGDLNRAFPKNSSREICREPWLHHILGPRFFLQLPDLYCRISVNCNQLPEPAHYFAPTSSSKHPNWTVANFQLVFQEFHRVDQLVTDSVRCRVPEILWHFGGPCVSCMTKTLFGALLLYLATARSTPPVAIASFRAKKRPTRCSPSSGKQ